MNKLRFLSLGFVVALTGAQIAQAQTATTPDYKQLVIVEGVGLVDGPTNAKYITLGMSKKFISTSVAGVFCPQTADFCWVSPSSETGFAIATFDANKRVSQLMFYQDQSTHKWATRKGAADGMTLAAVHALYKGSTLETNGDPNVYPTVGSVRTKSGNYEYFTTYNCEDTGCAFQTNSRVQKGSKPTAP